MNDNHLSEFKQILLETFENFILLCNKHNLKYYGAFGTVLGAVRHQGLIPWDDDIDVYMPRDDYEKLLSLRKHLDNNYEIIDLSYNGYYQDFAKFVNKNTSLVESKEIPFVCGIYIDVFPLDEWDESYTDFEKDNHQFNKAFTTYFKSIRNHSVTSLINAIKERDWKLSIKTLTNICFYKFQRESSLKRINYCLQKFRTIKGEYWCRYSTFPPESLIYPKDWFADGCEMRFENLVIVIPKEYDKYLQKKYGNYMELPPEDKRNSGHRQFYVNLKERLTFDEIVRRKKDNPNLIIE